MSTLSSTWVISFPTTALNHYFLEGIWSVSTPSPPSIVPFPHVFSCEILEHVSSCAGRGMEEGGAVRLMPQGLALSCSVSGENSTREQWIVHTLFMHYECRCLCFSVLWLLFFIFSLFWCQSRHQHILISNVHCCYRLSESAFFLIDIFLKWNTLFQNYWIYQEANLISKFLCYFLVDVCEEYKFKLNY